MSDSSGMKTDHYNLYIERHDPARNMARFYALSIETTLFGEITVSRRWGRIGTHGRHRDEVVLTERVALERLCSLLVAKRKRGYRPPILGAAECG